MWKVLGLTQKWRSYQQTFMFSACVHMPLVQTKLICRKCHGPCVLGCKRDPENNRTFTFEYHSNGFDQQDTKIRQNRSCLKKTNNLSSRQPSRDCIGNGQFVVRFAWRSSYFPDLASSDFHVFPKLEKFVSRKRFASNQVVVISADEYFPRLPDFRFRGITRILKKCWTECVKSFGLETLC